GLLRAHRVDEAVVTALAADPGRALAEGRVSGPEAVILDYALKLTRHPATCSPATCRCATPASRSPRSSRFPSSPPTSTTPIAWAKGWVWSRSSPATTFGGLRRRMSPRECARRA